MSESMPGQRAHVAAPASTQRARAVVRGVRGPSGVMLLRMRVSVDPGSDDGQRVLLQVLDAFDDNVNRMGVDFESYESSGVDSLKTGQVVHVGGERSLLRPTSPPKLEARLVFDGAERRQPGRIRRWWRKIFSK